MNYKQLLYAYSFFLNIVLQLPSRLGETGENPVRARRRDAR